MNELKKYILKHPTRIKYILIIINIFLVLISVKMYVNYLSIKTAIQETKYQAIQKELELAFSENFLLNYEKSTFSKYFLQHENNVLGPREFIVKFEKMPQKTLISGDSNLPVQINLKKETTNSASNSRKHFLFDKLSKVW